MMMNDPAITARTRETERRLALLFASETPFSTRLSKWSDPLLPDKYDHNCFSFGSTPPEAAEIEAAKAFQLAHGDRFLKLEGEVPLPQTGGLKESLTLTMVLPAREVMVGTQSKASSKMQYVSFRVIEKMR